jgi:hypothetical protein
VQNRKIIAIAGGAGGTVAILVVALIINYHATSNLQFRAQQGGGDFDFTTFSASALIDACNPTPFPASFERYTVDLYYRNENLAVMTIDGATIMPNDSETLRGTVDINEEKIADLFLQGLADAFSSQSEQQAGFSEEDMTARATLETKLLGVIPISQTEDIDLSESNSDGLGMPFSTREYSCT